MSDRSVEIGIGEQVGSSACIAGLLFVVNLAAGCAALERAPLDELPDTGTTQSAAIAVEQTIPSATESRKLPQTSTTQGAAVAVEPMVPPHTPHTPHTPSPKPPATGKTQGAVVALESVVPPVVAAGAPPQSSKTQGEDAAVKPSIPPAAPSVTRAADPLPAKGDPSAAKTQAKVAAAPVSPAPKEQPQKKESATTGPVKPEASPPLDLKSLETRLKETKAIGVFTKLTLKNQVDDLLNQFRAFYQGRIKGTLTGLRQAYDSLLLKVLALLQDTDPPLARAIVASREAIWGILSDPAKFATL